jgi:arabinose-5-phosphate isomerase
MAVLVEKGFRPEDFATLHPGGKLGQRLRRAEQLMHAGDDVPIVTLETPMRDVIYTMSSKGLGMTAVVDHERRLAGIITDGDLRRQMATTPDILAQQAGELMTRHPVTVSRQTLAAEVLALLERRKITSVVVVDGDQRVEGIVHLHDLWRTGMV